MTPVWTCAELAALLGCEESTVTDRARKGSLPGLKFGTSWVFPVEATVSRLNKMAEDGAYHRRNTAPSPQVIGTVGPPVLPKLPVSVVPRGWGPATTEISLQ